MNYSVAVIVPVYNVEPYLEECLESLVGQGTHFDEIILVNDGSTDRSQEICEQYCTHHPEIILVNQSNRGLGAARNAGLGKATGDYVVFVDSDDYITLDMSRKIRDYLSLYPVDILYYSAVMQYDILASEKAMTHSAELDFCKMTGKEYLYKSFPDSYSASACLSAYRRKFLEDGRILFPEDMYFEDNLFSLNAVVKAQDICCVPDKFYIRRCRAGSIVTGEASIKKCTDMVLTRKAMWEYLKEKMINTENADFISRFVFAGFLDVINYLGKATDPDVKDEQIKKIVDIFFEVWTPLSDEGKVFFNQEAAFLAVFREVEKWNEEDQTFLIKRFWDSKEQYMTMRQDLEFRLRIETMGRMKELPFYKDRCRVGVYGTGRHTEALLSLYRNLIGEIRCDLYFIVTEKTTDTYADRPVFAVSECKGLLDAAIISSRIYQEEMKENLIREGLDEKDMILLYRREDICDFIIINEILTAT